MGIKYPCEECHYQAAQKTQLISHHQSVHIGRKHQCLKCGNKNTEKSKLSRHQNQMHSDIRVV